MSGVLFIISTPIGNLEDISDRAKRVLNESDLLLVEDTRVTIKLLNHFGINKRMVSCHKFNEATRRGLLEEANRNGHKVALISDAGTPLISDPGSRMVNEAIELGMEVVAIPGPTACIQALIGSGLSCERFAFEGFLPDKESRMKERLRQLSREDRTLVFYVSPHSLGKTIQAMLAIFGDRRVCLARELTKRFEEYIRVSLSQLEDCLTEEKMRGEFSLVVEGARDFQVAVDPASVREFVLERLEEGAHSRDIAHELSDTFQLRKSEAYNLVISIKKETAK